MKQKQQQISNAQKKHSSGLNVIGQKSSPRKQPQNPQAVAHSSTIQKTNTLHQQIQQLSPANQKNNNQNAQQGIHLESLRASTIPPESNHNLDESVVHQSMQDTFVIPSNSLRADQTLVGLIPQQHPQPQPALAQAIQNQQIGGSLMIGPHETNGVINSGDPLDHPKFPPSPSPPEQLQQFSQDMSLGGPLLTTTSIPIPTNPLQTMNHGSSGNQQFQPKKRGSSKHKKGGQQMIVPEKNISAWPASNQQTITDNLGQTVNQLDQDAQEAYDNTTTRRPVQIIRGKPDSSQESSDHSKNKQNQQKNALKKSKNNQSPTKQKNPPNPPNFRKAQQVNQEDGDHYAYNNTIDATLILGSPSVNNSKQQMLRTGDLQGGPPETTQSAIKSELVKDALHKEMSETLLVDGGGSTTLLFDVNKHHAGINRNQQKLQQQEQEHQHSMGQGMAVGISGIKLQNNQQNSLNDKNSDYQQIVVTNDGMRQQTNHNGQVRNKVDKHGGTRGVGGIDATKQFDSTQESGQLSKWQQNQSPRKLVISKKSSANGPSDQIIAFDGRERQKNGGILESNHLHQPRQSSPRRKSNIDIESLDQQRNGGSQLSLRRNEASKPKEKTLISQIPMDTSVQQDAVNQINTQLRESQKHIKMGKQKVSVIQKVKKWEGQQEIKNGGQSINNESPRMQKSLNKDMYKKSNIDESQQLEISERPLITAPPSVAQHIQDEPNIRKIESIGAGTQKSSLGFMGSHANKFYKFDLGHRPEEEILENDDSIHSPDQTTADKNHRKNSVFLNQQNRQAKIKRIAIPISQNRHQYPTNNPSNPNPFNVVDEFQMQSGEIVNPNSVTLDPYANQPAQFKSRQHAIQSNNLSMPISQMSRNLMSPERQGASLTSRLMQQGDDMSGSKQKLPSIVSSQSKINAAKNSSQTPRPTKMRPTSLQRAYQLSSREKGQRSDQKQQVYFEPVSIYDGKGTAIGHDDDIPRDEVILEKILQMHKPNIDKKFYRLHMREKDFFKVQGKLAEMSLDDPWSNVPHDWNFDFKRYNNLKSEMDGKLSKSAKNNAALQTGENGPNLGSQKTVMQNQKTRNIEKQQKQEHYATVQNQAVGKSGQERSNKMRRQARSTLRSENNENQGAGLVHLSRKLQTELNQVKGQKRERTLEQVREYDRTQENMTRKRAPQNSSKSQSPFLVANKASFDVLKLLDKIEEKKVQELDKKSQYARVGGATTNAQKGNETNLNITDDPSLLVENERWVEIDKFWQTLEPKKLQWEKKKMLTLIRQGRQYLLPGEKDEEGEFLRQEEQLRKRNTQKMKNNLKVLNKQKTSTSIVTSGQQSQNSTIWQNQAGPRQLSMFVEAKNATEDDREELEARIKFIRENMVNMGLKNHHMKDNRNNKNFLGYDSASFTSNGQPRLGGGGGSRNMGSQITHKSSQMMSNSAAPDKPSSIITKTAVLTENDYARLNRARDKEFEKKAVKARLISMKQLREFKSKQEEIFTNGGGSSYVKPPEKFISLAQGESELREQESPQNKKFIKIMQQRAKVITKRLKKLGIKVKKDPRYEKSSKQKENKEKIEANKFKKDQRNQDGEEITQEEDTSEFEYESDKGANSDTESEGKKSKKLNLSLNESDSCDSFDTRFAETKIGEIPLMKEDQDGIYLPKIEEQKIITIVPTDLLTDRFDAPNERLLFDPRSERQNKIALKKKAGSKMKEITHEEILEAQNEQKMWQTLNKLNLLPSESQSEPLHVKIERLSQKEIARMVLAALRLLFMHGQGINFSEYSSFYWANVGKDRLMSTYVQILISENCEAIIDQRVTEKVGGNMKNTLNLDLLMTGVRQLLEYASVNPHKFKISSMQKVVEKQWAKIIQEQRAHEIKMTKGDQSDESVVDNRKFDYNSGEISDTAQNQTLISARSKHNRVDIQDFIVKKQKSGGQTLQGLDLNYDFGDDNLNIPKTERQQKPKKSLIKRRNKCEFKRATPLKLDEKYGNKALIQNQKRIAQDLDAIDENSLKRDIITVPIIDQEATINPLSRKSTMMISPMKRKSTLRGFDLEKILQAKKTVKDRLYKVEPIERTHISEELMQFLTLKGFNGEAYAQRREEIKDLKYFSFLIKKGLVEQKQLDVDVNKIFEDLTEVASVDQFQQILGKYKKDGPKVAKESNTAR